MFFSWVLIVCRVSLRIWFLTLLYCSLHLSSPVSKYLFHNLCFLLILALVFILIGRLCLFKSYSHCLLSLLECTFHFLSEVYHRIVATVYLCLHFLSIHPNLYSIPTYSIHTDVMSDVVLENTLDIKCIFKQAVLFSLFCSGGLFFFFFYLIIKL